MTAPAPRSQPGSAPVRDLEKPVKVTVSDPETGAIFDERIVDNDYAIICAGKRYVKSVQVFGGRPSRATHMIAVAFQKDRP